MQNFFKREHVRPSFFHVQRDISRYVVKRKRDINFPIISLDS